MMMTMMTNKIQFLVSFDRAHRFTCRELRLRRSAWMSRAWLNRAPRLLPFALMQPEVFRSPECNGSPSHLVKKSSVVVATCEGRNILLLSFIDQRCILQRKTTLPFTHLPGITRICHIIFCTCVCPQCYKSDICLDSTHGCTRDLWKTCEH